MMIMINWEKNKLTLDYWAAWRRNSYHWKQSSSLLESQNQLKIIIIIGTNNYIYRYYRKFERIVLFMAYLCFKLFIFQSFKMMKDTKIQTIFCSNHLGRILNIANNGRFSIWNKKKELF